LSVEGRFRSQPWLSDDLEGYKTEAVGFLDVPPGALSDRSKSSTLDSHEHFSLWACGLEHDGPISDNPIMTDISATDASKRFADVLDAVEHRGEIFTVVRRGRAIATVAPTRRSTLGELRGFLHDHSPDPEWDDDLADLRRFVGGAPMRDPWKD
jgi:antitoxin (DNA-binding transcriptional repressor) of toxin-antitoxin stability system